MDDAAASKKKSGKQSKAGSDEKAVEIRDAAMQSREKKVKGIEFCYHQSMHDVYMWWIEFTIFDTLDPEAEPSPSSSKAPKRPRNDRLLDIMEEELKIKRRQQDIEDSKMKMEEEKWKVEKEEKLAMLELLKKNLK